MNRIVNLETATTTVCPVNVSEREAKIKALVAKKIKALKEEHEREISDVESLTANWFGKEFTVEEYKSMIAEAEERLRNVPKDYSLNERIAYQKTAEKEIEYIKRDMQRMLDFKDYLKRVERDMYKMYPLNIYQVIDNVKSHIKNSISSYQQDITMDYHDYFMDKIMKLLPKDGKDYSKTVSLMFRTRTNNKSMKTIFNFFKTLVNKLNVAVSMFSNFNTNEYDKLQELLKSFVNKLIRRLYTVITKYLEEYIGCIPNRAMTELDTVKIYAENFIDNMNEELLQELPHVLNNAMEEEFAEMKEWLKFRSEELLEIGISKDEADAEPPRCKASDLGRSERGARTESPSISYTDGSPDVEVVITKPKVEVVITKPKPDFAGFLETVGNDSYSADEIVAIYNNHFGVNIKIESLAKRAEFKENFTNRRVMKSGKSYRVYTLSLIHI